LVGVGLTRDRWLGRCHEYQPPADFYSLQTCSHSFRLDRNVLTHYTVPKEIYIIFTFPKHPYNICSHPTFHAHRLEQIILHHHHPDSLFNGNTAVSIRLDVFSDANMYTYLYPSGDACVSQSNGASVWLNVNKLSFFGCKNRLYFVCT
jgi:hypothetical protein